MQGKKNMFLNHVQLNLISNHSLRGGMSIFFVFSLQFNYDYLSFPYI